MRELIKMILNLVGIAREQEKGIILEDELFPTPYKNREEFEYLKRKIEFLVTDYHQKGNMIADEIDEAKANCPKNVKGALKFKRQSSKKVAKSLCNSITRMIYTALEKNKDINFAEFYLKAFLNKVYIYKSSIYSYTQNNCIDIMKHYFNLDKYEEYSFRKYKQARLIEIFLESDKRFCLIRIKGHTFLGMKNFEGTAILCYDTYHSKFNGVDLIDRNCKIKWLYWY